MRPLLIDLYCCAGGSSVGYDRAGFDVIGVDKDPYDDYPYELIVMDAIEFLQDGHWRKYDPAALHGSPPCQFHTALAKGTNNNQGSHVNLIPPTRELFKSTGLPWVIENVPSAPLLSPITLCGEMFGLDVIRHRLFESNVWIPQPEHVKHRGRVAGYRHGEWFEGPYFAVYGNGGGKGSLKQWQDATGNHWMTTKHELAESLPWKYTHYIGQHLIEQLGA